MFDRIFGGTVEEQLDFLGKCLTLTIVACIVGAVGSIFGSEEFALIFSLIPLIWGWSVIKNWFGFASLASIFTGNVVIGVLVFMLYIFIAFISGMFFALLGLGRWIYLIIKYRN